MAPDAFVLMVIMIRELNIATLALLNAIHALDIVKQIVNLVFINIIGNLMELIVHVFQDTMMDRYSSA